MKHICAVIMTSLFIVLCVLLVTESRDVTGKYEACIKQAKEQEKKGLYLNAISKYKEALEIYNGDQNIKYQIVCNYKNMGNLDSWITAAKLFVDNFPEDIDDTILISTYREIIEYYYENKDYENLIPLLNQLRDKTFSSDANILKEKVIDYYQEIRSIYTVINCNAEYISDFYQNFALEKLEGESNQYLISETGNHYNEEKFEEIFLLDAKNGYSLVKENGQYKVYTANGYLKEIDENEITDVKYYSNAYLVGKKDGKYHMYTSAFQSTDFGNWDDFCLISPGIACVSTDGIYQLLVGNTILETEDDIWESIIYNDRGIKENNRCFFVGKEGKYKLISLDIEKLEYKVILEDLEDAQAFNTYEPAAIKKNEKWGFVSSTGEIVIEPKYDEAKSFSYGYAPVKINGKWTLIDIEGMQVMEPQFEDMGAPTESGIVPVKTESGKWDLISLFIKNYS